MGRPQTTEVAPGALAYHIEIELAESLVAPLDRALLDSNADLPLFVFIKATSGPPMPLAVKKLTLGEQGAAAFPMNVVLTQEDSMVPSLRLQDFKTVDVIARLSKSGQPMARPGDWQGRLTNVDQMKSGSSAMPLKLVVSEEAD